MTELIFVEGISGVGKTTAVHMLTQRLKRRGYRAKAYAEGDDANPIDFYCTACLGIEEYATLFTRCASQRQQMERNTIDAGIVKLVRYRDDQSALFEEPLLSELASREFCYKPTRLVPPDVYSSACEEVWRQFSCGLDEAYDGIVFDGSLLHHPLNDMMRNYQITACEAKRHIRGLLRALGERKRRIFYLETQDTGTRLRSARMSRHQKPLEAEQIAFWESRHQMDRAVLNDIGERCDVLDITDDTWNEAIEQMERRVLSQWTR